MTIDPTTLPAGTVVTLHGSWFGRVEETDDSDEITGTLVPVPDGMDPADAERILAEHVEWVPLPDGIPGRDVEGCRLRAVGDTGKAVTVSGPMEWEESGLTVLIGGSRVRRGDGWEWFIHPDDVPTDPDAELVAHLASEFDRTWVNHRKWDAHYKTPASVFTALAERALAVVREHEAQR